MKHETNVSKMPLEELRAVYAEREYRRAKEEFRPTEEEQFFRGLENTDEAVEALVQGHYAEGGDRDGAWEAHCTCGWAANNPVPSEQHAQEAADNHLAAYYGE